MAHDSSSTRHKRALAYVRISSQRQVNGESPETQRASIAQYAALNDIEIVDTYYDEAKSGKNTDREELQKMLAYAEQHKEEIDYVIVYKMNRASRDLSSYVLNFSMKLKALGIGIRSATEQIDETPLGQFMEGFSVLIGQMDNETKRGFTVDNMTALSLQGYWQHPPVVGYETHKIPNDIGKLRPTLKPSRMAPLVKDVLERFSVGDITKAELTRYAASVGLRSRYGKKMGEDAIHKMLSKPIYAGYVIDNFTQGVHVEGKHEAIISRETFELNQSLLYGKRKRSGEVRQQMNPDYPLKGTLICPQCGNPLYASAPQTGAGGKSPRYHCSRTSCKGLVKSVKASVVHADFKDVLRRIQPDESVLELYKEVVLTRATNELGTLNEKIALQRSKLDTIADNRLSAIRKFNADQLTADEKNDLVEALDDDKEVVLDNLRRLEQQQSIREADVDLAVNVMRDTAAQWSVASPNAKVRFQKALFPEGLIYDYENGRFGTSQISALYRVLPNKKDSKVPLKSFLVAGVGFEPTTLWL